MALACHAGADAPPPTAATPADPTVIVLSLDGVRHDYLDRGTLPAFARIERDGLRAGRLVPVYPSTTFPSHVSLATGTTPDVHGIVDNRFRDRERGVFDYSNDASWIEAEPLWAAAERQGVTAAAFFWVGSATDWRGVGASHRVAPFDSRIGEARKVDRILAWLDLPPASRPRLVMSWWHGADRAGHRHGPDDPAVLEALGGQDRELGRLLAGLDARAAWSHTTLVVVSDHGMTTAEQTVPLRRALAGVDAQFEIGATVAHVFVDGPAALASAERALAGLEGVRVERGERLPAELRLRHPTRTGDLVVRCEPGFAFDRGVSDRAARVLGRRRGVHGYAPEHPDMAGIFLALGRGVPAGARPPSVRAIDVAPSVAALLGIDPPRDAEGAPIGALAPATDR